MQLEFQVDPLVPTRNAGQVKGKSNLNMSKRELRSVGFDSGEQTNQTCCDVQYHVE